MTDRTEDQITFVDLGIWSGKTCRDAPLQQGKDSQKAQTSKESSLKSAKSSAKKVPLFLSLRGGGLMPDASLEWVIAASPFPSLGDFTMDSFGERPSMLTEECACEALPNGVSESRLSQTLEASVPPKFYLSERACLGILDRSRRKGKELPSELREALEYQAGLHSQG